MTCVKNMKLLFAAIAVGFAGFAVFAGHQSLNPAFCMHGRVLYAALTAGCATMAGSCLKSVFADTRLRFHRVPVDLRA